MRPGTLAAFGLAAAAGVCVAQTAEFTALPADFEPIGISPDGRVVLGTFGSPLKPGMWTAEDGLVQLRGPAGQSYSGKAWGASRDGSVIVGTYRNGSNAQTPFRWTAATGIVAIPDVSRDLPNAYDTSEDGSVVIGQGSRSGGGTGAWSWTAAGGTRPLAIPEGALSAWALSLSLDGRFATGHAAMADGSNAMIRWDLRQGTARVWPNPSGPGPSAEGVGVNQDGEALIGNMSIDGRRRLVLTTSWGLHVPEIPPEAIICQARAITPDARWVVGRSYAAGTGYRAIIYSQGLEVVDLKDWVEREFGLDLTGIVLEDAVALSEDGRTIVGTGTPSSWMLRLPPELPGDFNGDNAVDFFDFNAFIDCFEGDSVLPQSSADVDHDGFVDFFDVEYFLEHF